MEGIHVGFDRRICTDASSKPLPIADVLSADFSSPWHKSDGQNCVAPAMERFSSEFWCGGRRNTRVFQGRQAGNHRKSPMSGGTDPFHVCPCFLFVLLFRSQGTFSPGENELLSRKVSLPRVTVLSYKADITRVFASARYFTSESFVQIVNTALVWLYCTKNHPYILRYEQTILLA